MLLAVVLVNAGYPSLLFRVLVPLGLLFLFGGLALYGIGYLIDLKSHIASKNYLIALVMIVAGVVVLVQFFL